MKIAKIGSDYVELNEQNFDKFVHIDKIHLIKMDFVEPTEEMIRNVLNLYPNTNRFVVSNNIKLYNDLLKTTNKKYYVENTESFGFITFFRKNNKVLLNFVKLNDALKDFVLDNLLFDVLKNVEVILIKNNDFIKKENILKNWNGNIVIVD